MKIAWIALVISIVAVALAAYGVFKPVASPTPTQAGQQQANKPAVSVPSVSPGQQGSAPPSFSMPPVSNMVPPLYTPANK